MSWWSTQAMTSLASKGSSGNPGSGAVGRSSFEAVVSRGRCAACTARMSLPTTSRRWRWGVQPKWSRGRGSRAWSPGTDTIARYRASVKQNDAAIRSDLRQNSTHFGTVLSPGGDRRRRHGFTVAPGRRAVRLRRNPGCTRHRQPSRCTCSRRPSSLPRIAAQSRKRNSGEPLRW
jgi:hypothetical protein